MPMFFWLPMIIFGGIWKIAADSAPRAPSQAPTPGMTAVIASAAGPKSAARSAGEIR